ncbi:protein FAM76B-like isoform X3 [Mizuhopecten yessoensis]|uniref:protein FAM76B-like isoform X3 n=1 Tax=Mizuhopecten yessoensis TaxID=6573 RepID=UPI000B45A2B1|nr:protein FAM76B-like isoform X3 [Mizuhopecten yessoensis]
MAALFACTKCHTRHPFEELSQAEQLCKECRSNFPVVKCTYCRAEFQQEDKSNTNSICKKCDQNVKVHGKPSVCEYCNILAAFIGNKCQRCANSERRWGQPLTCEQCKQKCAFDRTDGTRKKVDGKLLCWLCTLAYKRALAKAKQRKDEDRKNLGSLRPTKEKPDKAEKLFDSVVGKNNSKQEESSKNDSGGSTSSRHSNSSQGDRMSNGSDKGASDGQEGAATKEKSERSHKHHHHHHHHHHKHSRSKDHRRSHSTKSSHKSSHSDTSSQTPPTKKARVEISSANGMTPTKREDLEVSNLTEKSRYSFLKDSSFSMSLSSSLSMLNASSATDKVDDPHSSEHLIALQQLQDQMETMRKQLQAKDQQLMEKDKLINELKAQAYETDKEFRLKIQTIHKHHTGTLESLTTKNTELAKQIKEMKPAKGKNIRS